MTTFAIAGIQMDVPQADNIEKMTKYINSVMARFPWVQMIIFGELCVFGTSLERAQSLPGPTESHFCNLATKHNIWILPGSVYELANDKIYNTTSVINPQGEVVVRHRKLFPFSPYEKGITAGKDHTLFDVPDVGRFGVSICYDMWFPETTRALACLGAEVILHPTLTNTIDRDLELAIARSSAGINQTYFFDINNTGTLGYGKSIIVGPDGDVIYQAERGEEVMPIIVDLERVRRTRERGVLGLGQTLKSFKESNLEYPQYQSHFN